MKLFSFCEFKLSFCFVLIQTFTLNCFWVSVSKLQKQKKKIKKKSKRIVFKKKKMKNNFNKLKRK